MIKELAKKIVLYLNESGRGFFTESELQEFTEEFHCSIENGEFQYILSALKDEYKDTKDGYLLGLIKELVSINLNMKGNDVKC